jgi:hypothetical protein
MWGGDAVQAAFCCWSLPSAGGPYEHIPSKPLAHHDSDYKAT